MKHLAALIFITTLFTFNSLSQENDFDKLNLTFQLEGEPTIEEVGFDNPKSSWKVKYEVFVADFAELEKLGKCGYVEGRSIKNCSNLTDKKLDKKIRKMATRIGTGKLSQNQLSKDENRKLIRTLELPLKAFNIFQEARQIYEKNPVLIIYISSKISTKNSSGNKLKKRYETEGFNWWKIYNADKTIEYRDLAKLTYHLVVQKTKDGLLQLNVGYVHFG